MSSKIEKREAKPKSEPVRYGSRLTGGCLPAVWQRRKQGPEFARYLRGLIPLCIVKRGLKVECTSNDGGSIN